MKIGIVHLVVLALSAAAPVGAAEAGPAVAASPAVPLATGTDTGPAPAAVPLDDLVPLGPPTGARDELTVKSPAPTSVVPEPATLAVFGVGLLLLFRRRSAA